MATRLASIMAACVGVGVAAYLSLMAYAATMQYRAGDTVTLDFARQPAEASSEAGLLLRQGKFYVQRCCATSTVRGPEGLTFQVAPSDPHVKGNLRAEGRLLSNRIGRDAIYDFELSPPAQWPQSDQRVVVAQWHGTNDFFLFEPGRYPPLELTIEGDRWVLYKAWDDRLRSLDRGGGNTEGRKIIGVAPFAPGRDAHWRIVLHWSTRSDGRVRALLNGKPVANDKGPNALRDIVGPYMKFGVYVPNWKSAPDHAVGRRSVLYRRVSMRQL